MFRHFPRIAVASLAILTIGLNVYLGPTPTSQQAVSQGSNTSEATQSPASPAQAKKTDPDLASKLLTGEAAGVTLKKLDEFPDLDNVLKGAGAQIEPVGCLNTGITQLETGAAAVTQTEAVSLLLSSDPIAPGRYKEYAQRCSSASGTVAGSPVRQNIEQQQAPAVEGMNDLVTATVSSESTINDKAVNTEAYLLVGNVNGNTVVAQSMTLRGGESSSRTAIKPLKAQVGRIRG